MRTARLDHDPLAGIVPLCMVSSVPQPFHAIKGEVRHPIRETPEKQRPKYATIVADWVAVLNALGTNLEVSRWLSCDRKSVLNWRTGKYAPDPELAHALVALYRKRFRGPVPGLREAE